MFIPAFEENEKLNTIRARTGRFGSWHREDVPDNDLIVAELPFGELMTSPTLAVAVTQFSPSDPVSVSPTLFITLPGRKKKNHALAPVDTHTRIAASESETEMFLKTVSSIVGQSCRPSPPFGSAPRT